MRRQKSARRLLADSRLQALLVFLFGMSLVPAVWVSCVKAQGGGWTPGRNALPVKVGADIVYVVPVSEMPPVLQERLYGEAAFVVVDSRGKVVGNKNAAFEALVAHHVARTLLDDPTRPGWDVEQATKTASLYEASAAGLRKINLTQNLISLSDEVAALGARLFVLSVVPQSPWSVVSSAAKALLELFADPRNASRVLFSADLIAAEAALRLAARQLQTIKGYPLDSKLAFELLQADMVALPLGGAATLARINLEVPDALLPPLKAALDQLTSTLAAKMDSPTIRMAEDVYQIGKRVYEILKLIPEMAAYLAEREGMIHGWYRLQSNYLTMAEAIVAAGGSVEQERVWQAKLLWSKQVTKLPIWDIEFSPDGRLLWVASGSEYALEPHRVFALNAEDGSVAQTIKFDNVGDPGWLVTYPDGRVVVYWGGEEFVVKTNDNSTVEQLSPGVICSSSDSNWVVVSSGRRAQIVSIESGRVEREFELEEKEMAVCQVRPVWRLLGISLRGDRLRVRQIDGASPWFERETRLGFMGEYRGLSVAPDGQYVAVTFIDVRDKPDGLVITRHALMVLRLSDGRVVWSFSTKFREGSPDGPPPPHGVFSPTGELIALAGDDGVVRIWRVSDGSLVLEHEMPFVYAVAFSPSGDHFAAAGFDGEVRLWALESQAREQAESASPNAQASAPESAWPAHVSGMTFFDDFDRVEPASWSFKQAGEGSMRVVNGLVELYDIDMASEHYAQLESAWFISEDWSRVEVRARVDNRNCGYACEGWGVLRIELQDEQGRVLGWEMPWQGEWHFAPQRFFVGLDRKNVWETAERDDKWHTVGFEKRGNEWFLSVDGDVKVQVTYPLARFKVVIRHTSAATYGYPARSWVDWVKVEGLSH